MINGSRDGKALCLHTSHNPQYTAHGTRRFFYANYWQKTLVRARIASAIYKLSKRLTFTCYISQIAEISFIKIFFKKHLGFAYNNFRQEKCTSCSNHAPQFEMHQEKYFFVSVNRQIKTISHHTVSFLCSLCSTFDSGRKTGRNVRFCARK